MQKWDGWSSILPLQKPQTSVMSQPIFLTESDRVAIIVETRTSLLFEFSVRSTMHMLGPAWTLLVCVFEETERNYGFSRWCTLSRITSGCGRCCLIFLRFRTFDSWALRSWVLISWTWQDTAASSFLSIFFVLFPRWKNGRFCSSHSGNIFELQEHFLIFQTDTLMLYRNNLDDWLDYDYVGAPWCW